MEKPSVTTWSFPLKWTAPGPVFDLGETEGWGIYPQRNTSSHLWLLMPCFSWTQCMLASARCSSVLASELSSCPDHTKQLLLQQHWGETWADICILFLEQKAGQLLTQEPRNAPGDAQLHLLEGWDLYHQDGLKQTILSTNLLNSAFNENRRSFSFFFFCFYFLN